MLVYFSHNKALWKKTHNVTDERNNPLLMPRVAFYSAKHERKTTKRSSSLFSSSSSFGKENQQHWLCSFGILKSDIPFLVCRVFYLSLQILQISTLTNARIGAKSWCRGHKICTEKGNSNFSYLDEINPCQSWILQHKTF